MSGPRQDSDQQKLQMRRALAKVVNKFGGDIEEVEVNPKQYDFVPGVDEMTKAVISDLIDQLNNWRN